MANMNLYQRACLIVLLLAAIAVASPAQTFTTLFSFDKSNGGNPTFPSLVQGLDGNLYGTTPVGGKKQGGTVFRVTTGGMLATLYNFCAPKACPDGAVPKGGVVLGTDGNFYGTAEFGGSTGSGTAFKMTPAGLLTTYSLVSVGSNPLGGLIQAASGDFYGTAGFLGDKGGGTVFRMTLGGTLAAIYNFCAKKLCPDGRNPFAGVVQGTDGNLYGTTSAGGAGFVGTVFKLSLRGLLTRLYSFDTTDGAAPNAALIQASDGNFYGTTELGGVNAAGTIFQITPTGTLTTLYDFCTRANCTDGKTPVAGLVQATDGNFYGTTESGGANGDGTIFQLTPEGTLTTLYSFCVQANCADGGSPLAGLVQATDGNLYGAACVGGTNNVGTIFSLAMGLSPFVETLPAFGNVGGAVKILGTNLTGATSVSINGTAAKFTVVSGSEIDTAVPDGATTGFVSVTTPNGTLTSNVAFRVGP
jgi:uncharacterized repeat protein (TIGR03803 family)